MNENANTDFSSLCYTAFGDSITFGSDRSLSYAQMAHPYPEQVARLLKLASYDNRGVSGATFCENDLDRTCMTDNILSYREKTDIISVMLGVNDYSVALPLGENGDFSKRTVYGCLNMIAEHLTLVHGESFIFFMTPYKTARVSEAPYSL
jgi:lysophospholipase L1-like esterase